MCTPTRTGGRPVKYCVKPMTPCSEFDAQQERPLRAADGRVGADGEQQRDQADGQPDQHHHQVGVQLGDARGLDADALAGVLRARVRTGCR